MSNRKSPAGESGSFNPFALAVAAIAVCAVSAAVLLAPAKATHEVSTGSSAAYAGPTDYLPGLIANQAKEIEPMPEMYY